jgi:deoxycytidylate deaminase
MDNLWKVLEEEENKTNCKKRKVACLIYDTFAKEIVSVGHNYHKDGECDCYTTRTPVHAEQQAVLNMKEKRPKGQLVAYITCSPCENCKKVLDKAVSEVRYKTK